MLKFLEKSLFTLFNLLFFFVPLIFYPSTSELFEFNKMIFVYTMTVLICLTWVLKMILNRKFFVRRTILDIPLLIFLGSQFLATVFSFDFRTSLLGYYSRFNGGFLSTLSYTLLFFAFTTNINKEKGLFILKSLLISGFLVSLYGILEHFGIDKDIWVQDVQNRVFSSLGQPNWLAAFLVILLPVSWAFFIKERKTNVLWLIFSTVFFVTLLFTKSRSGLLGFALADFIFCLLALVINKKEAILKTKPLLLRLGLLNLIFVVFVLALGTPFSPRLSDLFNKKEVSVVTPQTVGPALETGGTESGEIRKIVWEGAFEIFKHHPVLGTGVETFAFSYYNFRPERHNLVSEWDFLYNKAHNEYLNIMANTGTIGIISYLLMVVVFFKFLAQKLLAKEKEENAKLMLLALGSGYASILVTNFFGFSVVVISLLTFLIPAFVFSLLNVDAPAKTKEVSLQGKQKALMVFSLTVGFWFLFLIARYWYADTLYAKGQSQNDSGNPVKARANLVKAINLSPQETIYWMEIAEADTTIATALSKDKDQEKEMAQIAISEAIQATTLSPKNPNLERALANIYIRLSGIDETYLFKARDAVLRALKLAPTDAKLKYNLGLVIARVGENDKAITILKETIAMKANYREPRYALALLLIDKNLKTEAREQLNYILEKINPKDEASLKLLKSLQ